MSISFNSLNLYFNHIKKIDEWNTNIDTVICAFVKLPQTHYEVEGNPARIFSLVFRK